MASTIFKGDSQDIRSFLTLEHSESGTFSISKLYPFSGVRTQTVLEIQKEQGQECDLGMKENTKR